MCPIDGFPESQTNRLFFGYVLASGERGTMGLIFSEHSPADLCKKWDLPGHVYSHIKAQKIMLFLRSYVHGCTEFTDIILQKLTK